MYLKHNLDPRASSISTFKIGKKREQESPGVVQSFMHIYIKNFPYHGKFFMHKLLIVRFYYVH